MRDGEHNGFEVFVPEKVMAEIILGFGNDGALRYWRRLKPRPCYPAGVRATPWNNIVWSYKVYFQD